MKNKIIILITLALTTMIALLISCNKGEKDLGQNQVDNETEICHQCNNSFYEISSYQKNVIENFIKNENIFSLKDSDYEFVGVVDLLDETVDYSTIVLRQTGQIKKYYTFIYDNECQDINLYGVANFEITGDTIDFTLTFNEQLYLEAKFDAQHMVLLSFVENIPGDKAPNAMGNDIMDCYRLAKQICQNDPDCSTMCDFLTWQYCDTVFFLGCVGSHIKARIMKLFR